MNNSFMGPRRPDNYVDPAKASAMFHRVVAEVDQYMGAQAEQFVLRQMKHTRITPELLNAEDIPVLAKWIENSSRLVLQREKAQQLYQKIMSLQE
jgi:hypothetical protein